MRICKTKDIGHGIYSIVRKQEVIHNIHNLYNLRFNPKNEYDILGDCIGKRRYNIFGLVLSKHTKYALFESRNVMKKITTLHALCQSHWYKGYKLFDAFLTHYLNKTYVNVKDNTINNDKKRLLKTILMAKGFHDRPPLMDLVLHQKDNSWSKSYEIEMFFKMCIRKYFDIIDWGYESDLNETVLALACLRGHHKCCQLLLDLSCSNYIGNKRVVQSSQAANKCLVYCLRDDQTGVSIKTIKVLLDSKYYAFNKHIDLTKLRIKDKTIYKYIEENCKAYDIQSILSIIKQFERKQKQ